MSIIIFILVRFFVPNIYFGVTYAKTYVNQCFRWVKTAVFQKVFVQLAAFCVIRFSDGKIRGDLFFCNAEKDYFSVKRGYISAHGGICFIGYGADVRQRA